MHGLIFLDSDFSAAVNSTRAVLAIRTTIDQVATASKPPLQARAVSGAIFMSLGTVAFQLRKKPKGPSAAWFRAYHTHPLETEWTRWKWFLSVSRRLCTVAQPTVGQRNLPSILRAIATEYSCWREGLAVSDFEAVLGPTKQLLAAWASE